jgi:hypothetical protein
VQALEAETCESPHREIVGSHETVEMNGGVRVVPRSGSTETPEDVPARILDD